MSIFQFFCRMVKRGRFVVGMVVILISLAGATYGKDIRVKADASGSNSGSSWANAYRDLQTALASAVSGDAIWVASGTYRPTSSTDRTKSFVMKTGVALYGGFAGTETTRGQRDWATRKTILSGDIGVRGNSDDNSYHVVVGNNNAILDGFVVTGGFSGVSDGAGMINDLVSPSIANCTFTTNTAAYGYGGGMYNSHASPTLTNCTFSGNKANGGGGGMGTSYGSPIITYCTFSRNSASDGAGMYSNYASPTITTCTFTANSAGSNGGGLYNGGVGYQPRITGSTFSGNTALNYGGGMYNNSAAAVVTNCSFAGNRVVSNGGGMSNYDAAQTVTNCTFSGNSAGSAGGGMYNSSGEQRVANCTFTSNTATSNGGGIYNYSGTPAIFNSILWDNNAPVGPEFYRAGGIPTFKNCDILGSMGSGAQWNAAFGTDSGGNIDADPRLTKSINPAGADGIFRTKDDGLALRTASPCIDAGDNAGTKSFDILGNYRPIDGDSNGQSISDIGAYEYLPKITGSVTWQLYQ